MGFSYINNKFIGRKTSSVYIIFISSKAVKFPNRHFFFITIINYVHTIIPTFGTVNPLCNFDH